VDENLQSALEDHLASMNDGDWRALVARVRPPEPTDPVSARQSIGAKAGQLWQVTQQVGADGYTAGLADAAAARQPTPQPQPPAAPTGFGVNRAQGASNDGPPAPAQQSDWSKKPRIYPPGGAF
jgi:hypothetical protein